MNWYATQNATLIEAGAPAQYSTGVTSWQQDSLFNRTAWFGPNGNNFVADFAAQIVYYVDYYRICQYTCTMDSDTPCDSQLNANNLCDFDYINHSSFVGEEEIDGVMTNKFAWYDPLVGVDMADHNVWISQADGLPVQVFHDMHPFGTCQART